MSAKKAKRPSASVALPPHVNAKAHRELMKLLKTMTPEEFLESTIRAGIHDKKGKLMPFYAATAK